MTPSTACATWFVFGFMVGLATATATLVLVVIGG